MKYIKRFILMIQFLTTIPIRVNLNVTNEDFGKGLVFAPLVGGLMGILLGLVMGFFNNFLYDTLTCVLIVLLYILLTGGLHLDGLGDTFDGLFSNRPKEKMLEIMRDSRVGTNAVLAIIMVILLDTALLYSIDWENAVIAVMMMPAAGRIGSLIGAGSSVYARSGEGLGKSFIDFCGIKEMVIGTVLYLLYIIAVVRITAGSIGWIIAGVIPIFTAWLLVKLFSRKIGGATGDILGAVCEINQTIFLFLAYLIIEIGIIV